MKIKCKVNDLAFIKKAIRPVNIGRVVTCKELLGKFAFGETIVWNGEEFASPEDDYMWVVSSSGNLETQFGPSKEAMIPDSWLTPIRAEPSENYEEEIAEDLGKELAYIDEGN